LLTNVNVKAFIKYLRDQAVSKTIADLVEVKQGLTEVVRSRAGNYIKIVNGNAVIVADEDSLKSAAIAEVTTETVKILGKESPLSSDITKLKFRDMIPAARLLAELSGWTKPEGSLNVNVNNTVNNVEARIAVFDPKEVALAIIEAERLGLPASVFGEAVNGEGSSVLPSSPNS
jgi:hypothetical protein